MKQLFIVIILLSGITCSAQKTEFNKSSNGLSKTEFDETSDGLIYSDTIIKQLRFIVDSLQVKFKAADFQKKYLSRAQAKGHFISLQSEKINEARKDIESNISFEAFERKYRNSTIKKDILVVQFRSKTSTGKTFVMFKGVDLTNKMEEMIYFIDSLSICDKPLKGKWIYTYSAQDEYSPESLEAFYLTEEFTQQSLPEHYARMINYSDCMIDTSLQVIYKKAHVSRPYSDSIPLKLKVFLDYVYKLTNRPDPADTVDFQNKYQLWDSLRISRINGIYKNDEKFKSLLDDAVKMALDSGGSTNEFEEYVELFNSKATALELKRNRKVVGYCSRDQEPRIHAFNIAKLAAETFNWGVFIRAHLDILNDRFNRTIDATYSWGWRQTYIGELVALGINVQDLMFGISLSIANPSKYHYSGNVSRHGRALTEATQSKEIETKIVQIISDSQLDDYNRILFYYLFLDYIDNLDSKKERAKNKARLASAVKTLPAYLAKKIN